MNKYREGKAKAVREDIEIILKPYIYKESKRVFISVTACLLKNEPTS